MRITPQRVILISTIHHHFHDELDKLWIITIFTGILLILSGVKIFMSGVAEKIRAMTFLGYFYVFALVVFGLFLLQSKWENEWILIFYVPVSILFSQFFTLSDKRWTIWLFFFTIVFFLGMFIWDFLSINSFI